MDQSGELGLTAAVITILLALPIAMGIVFWLGWVAIGIVERLLPYWLRPFLGPPWGGDIEEA